MLWAIGQPVQEFQRCCEVGHGFCHRRALDRLLPGLVPVINSFLDKACQCAVVCYQLWSRLSLLCEKLFESLHNAAMKLLALAPQQALVSCVLHQGVLEDVSRLRRLASAEY